MVVWKVPSVEQRLFLEVHLLLEFLSRGLLAVFALHGVCPAIVLRHGQDVAAVNDTNGPSHVDIVH